MSISSGFYLCEKKWYMFSSNRKKRKINRNKNKLLPSQVSKEYKLCNRKVKNVYTPLPSSSNDNILIRKIPFSLCGMLSHKMYFLFLIFFFSPKIISFKL